MKQILRVITLLVGLNSYSQIHFEKGYFVNNNDVRTECLIKNEDWRSNPDSFEYKISEDQATQEKGLAEIKEFGIGELYKYVKFDGKIDVSSKNLSQLTFNSQPQWEQKKVYLQVIIEGKAKLYRYLSGNIQRYFYSFNDSPIEQLIYKEYLEEGTNVIKKNKNFQRQLYSKVICDGIKTDQIMKLNYSESSLSEYFIEINNCYGDKSGVIGENKTGIVDRRNTLGNKFAFKAKAGVNSTAIEVDMPEESQIYPDVFFDKSRTFSIGFELEYFLPFNKNKWSLFFAPTYQSRYKDEKISLLKYKPVLYTENWNVSYKTLDLSLGLRYNMYLSDNSKIFLNGAVTYNSKLEGEIYSQTRFYEIGSMMSAEFGLGYSYKKASIELRYNKRNLLQNYLYVRSNFERTSITLGYTIFESKKKK